MKRSEKFKPNGVLGLNQRTSANPNGVDGLLFFNFLRKERSHLPGFQHQVTSGRMYIAGCYKRVLSVIRSQVAGDNPRWLPGSGYSATLARYDHIGFVTPTTGTDEPFMPMENRRLGTVPPRHFGGIGLNLMEARLAPYDEPHLSRRRTPERHRWAGFGFHRAISGYWRTRGAIDGR